jgi:hypothetical protein
LRYLQVADLVQRHRQIALPVHVAGIRSNQCVVCLPGQTGNYQAGIERDVMFERIAKIEQEFVRHKGACGIFKSGCTEYARQSSRRSHLLGARSSGHETCHKACRTLEFGRSRGAVISCGQRPIFAADEMNHRFADVQRIVRPAQPQMIGDCRVDGGLLDAADREIGPCRAAHLGMVEIPLFERAAATHLAAEQAAQ